MVEIFEKKLFTLSYLLPFCDDIPYEHKIEPYDTLYSISLVKKFQRSKTSVSVFRVSKKSNAILSMGPDMHSSNQNILWRERIPSTHSRR